MRRSKKTSPYENFYFSILKAIDKTSQTTAAKRLKMSKQNIYYYVNRLKKEGLIIKKGYGVFEVNWDLWNKRSKKNESSISPRSKKIIRGHYWQIKLNLQQDFSWKERLKSLNAPSVVAIHSGMFSLQILGSRVWLAKKSIIIYLNKDVFAETPSQSYSIAIYNLERIIRKIESLFNVSLKSGSKYKFKVCNSHYAILKNELAKQYNKEKKKLYVFDKEGCWLLIDFSQGQDELEGIGQKAKENTSIVQDFFNDLKETELMPSQVLNMIKKTTDNINNIAQKLDYYAENNVAHANLLKDLNISVNRLSKVVEVKRYKRSIEQKDLKRWFK